MSTTRRSNSPWAELSVAFDLQDRCHLSLPIFGDTHGLATRLWRFEQLCRRVRRISLIALCCTPLAWLSGVGLCLMSATISDFESAHGDSIGTVLAIWCLAWIGIPILTFVVGFCMGVCRLRTRKLMMLHAERLRRRNIQPLTGRPPSLKAMKSMLASTSLTQELVAPVIVIVVLVLLASYGYLVSVTGRFTFGSTAITLVIPLSIIVMVRVSNRTVTRTSKNLDLAFRTGACPSCQYSLEGAGPPVMIKRCPECGMRFPCRFPVNLPPPRPSLAQSLGTMLLRVVLRIQ